MLLSDDDKLLQGSIISSEWWFAMYAINISSRY